MSCPTPIWAFVRASNVPIGCGSFRRQRECSRWAHAGRHTRRTRAGISGDRWTETRISPTEPVTDRLDLFAIAAPGLEPIVGRELRTLGMDGVRLDAGGVA